MRTSGPSRMLLFFALLLGLACFIAAPVSSVEDPWDADDPGTGDGGDGDLFDTTNPGDDVEDPIVPDWVEGFGDWFNRLVFELSFGLSADFIFDNADAPGFAAQSFGSVVSTSSVVTGSDDSAN